MRSLLATLLMVTLTAAGCIAILDLEQYEQGAGGNTATGTGASAGSGAAGGDGGHAGQPGVGGAGGALSYRELVRSHNPDGYWRHGEADCSQPPCAALAEVGLPGVYQNAFTLGEEGVLPDDSAVLLTETDGHVSMGTSYAHAGAEPFTLELWMKPHPNSISGPSSCRGAGLISRELSTACSSNFWPGYVLRHNTSCKVNFQLSDCDAMVRLTPVSSTELNEPRWYHVVATFDGIEAAIYVDGKREDTDSSVAPKLPTDNATFVIGMRTGGGFGNFHGWVDETAVYGYALDQIQVAAHFLAGSQAR